MNYDLIKLLHGFSKKMPEFAGQNSDIIEYEEAILFAQEVQSLKPETPKNAVFPPIERFSVYKTGRGYEVIGFYDWQKSSGTVVRTSFAVHAVKNKTGWVML